MTNLVAWTPDDSKRIANAVKVIERGALEHPFHRARWPIASGDEITFVKISSIGTAFADDRFLGNRDDGGVKYEGDGIVVTRFTDDEAFSPIEFREGTVRVNARNFDGLLIPGRVYACTVKQNKYVPCDDGQSVFEDCITIDDVTSEETVRITVAGPALGYVNVECLVPITGEAVPAGTYCTVRWSGANSKFRIDGTGCPPT